MRKERNASECIGNSRTKFHKPSGQHPTALPLNQLTGRVIVYGEVRSCGQSKGPKSGMRTGVFPPTTGGNHLKKKKSNSLSRKNLKNPVQILN